MRKRITWRYITLAGLMALGLTGCGASSKGAATEAAVADSAYLSDDMYSYDNSYYEEAASEEYDSTTGSTENVEKVQDTSRKLIKNVDMSVETEEFDTLLANVEKRIEALGGYIETSNVYNGSTYKAAGNLRTANITARIPAERLNEFLSLVSEASNVISKNESVTDVTLQYVDMQSHKEALQTEQQRLLELLEQAETIDDIITIESRLSDVRYQIESMESQLRTYDNQVDNSTGNLYIDEVERYTPGAAKSAGARIAEGFSANIYRVGSFFKNFAIEFIILLPILIAIAIVLGIAILIVRIIIKISEKHQVGKKTSAKTEIKTGDRYRQKPGKEQIHGAEQTEKSGLCNAGRTPERGQVHTDESSDRTENRDHIQ